MNEEVGEESVEGTLGFDSVLVLSISSNQSAVLPGMVSEDKIMASVKVSCCCLYFPKYVHIALLIARSLLF